jgi:hypothetical protein
VETRTPEQLGIALRLVIEELASGQPSGVRLVFADNGPGMARAHRLVNEFTSPARAPQSR